MREFRCLILSLWAVTSFASEVLSQQKRLFVCNDTISEAYGVCAHVTRPQTDYPYLKVDLALIDSLRATFVRSDFDFTTMAIPEGEYHTMVFDSAVMAIRQSGLEMSAILDRKADGYAWDNMAAYANYVSFLVDRYSPEVKYWEVMNEFDMISDAGDVFVKYVDALRDVYPLIKSHDTTAVVLMSSLASPTGQALDRLGQLGAYDYFDVVNIHSYAQPENFLWWFRSLSDSMNKYGWSKPVWLTECGMHTAITPENEFYDKVLEAALQMVGISASNVTCHVIRDYDNAYSSASKDVVDHYLSAKFRDVSFIGLDGLSALPADDHSVLIASSGEAFPSDYAAALIDYVRRGGIVVFPYGLPFYYNQSVAVDKGRRHVVDERFLADLHVATLKWWSDKGKANKVSERASTIAAAFGVDLQLGEKSDFDVRYLTSDNLHRGDKFLPVVVAGDDNYMGAVTAVYDLNSDMQGTLIVNSRIDEEAYVNRVDEQARRIARAYIVAFACGVEKVFTYNLRALERDPYYSEHHYGIVHSDLTPKLAYKAYHILTSMLPDGSSRPTLFVDNDFYYATWTMGDKHLLAAWNVGGADRIYVSTDHNLKVYDYLGNIINVDNGVVDLADSVVFVKSRYKMAVRTEKNGRRVIIFE